MDARSIWPTAGQITVHAAAELLASLDQTDRIQGLTDPKDNRLPLALANIPLHVEHPGGGYSRFCCHTRYLCPTHIGVIVNRYMHKGSAAHVNIPTKWGVEESIEGVISECRYVRDSIHEVVVAFSAPVNMRLFLDVPAHYAADDCTDLDLRKLRGRTIIVNDNPADNMLLRHFLRRTEVQIKEATTMGAAIDMIRTDPYDLVFCGQSLCGLPIDRLIAGLRDADYSGPIVSIGDPTSGGSSGDVEALDCRAVLIKPIQQAHLLAVMNDILGGQAGLGDDGLTSNLPADPENAALVAWFVEHVKRVTHSLSKAVTADNSDEARQYLVTLRDTGVSYGYPRLSEQASALITALNACGSIAECRQQVSRLLDLTRNMRGIQSGEPRPESSAA